MGNDNDTTPREPIDEPYVRSVPLSADDSKWQVYTPQVEQPSTPPLHDPLSPLSSPLAPIEPLREVPHLTPVIASVAPPKNHKKRLIVTLIIAVIVFIASIGSLIYYLVWYQNPSRVVSEALVSALQARTVQYDGTATTQGVSDLSTSFTGRADETEIALDVKADVVTQQKLQTIDSNFVVNSQGGLFARVNDIEAAATVYDHALAKDNGQLLNTVAAQVDNRWVQLPPERLGAYSTELANAQKCIANARTLIRDDADLRREFFGLVQEHDLFSVEKNLGSRAGSFGYQLRFSGRNIDSFLRELKATTLGKKVPSCEQSIATLLPVTKKVSSDKSGTSTADIWVDRWSHTLTSVEFQKKGTANSFTATVNSTFNESVTIAPPKGAILAERLYEKVHEMVLTSTTAE